MIPDKYIYKILLGIFVLTFLINCSNKEKINTHNLSNKIDINLNKVRDFKIKNRNNESLDRVRDVIVFNNDNTLLGWVNEDKHEVFVTDTLGNILINFGSTGRGPRQFINISAIGFNHKDDIIVYDWQQDLFKFFNLDGKLLGTYKGLTKDELWIRSERIFTKNKMLYLAIQEAKKSDASNHWESKTIAKYSQKGILKSLFGSFDPMLEGTNAFYKNANLVLNNKNSSFFTTHRTSHTIQVFDLKTEIRKKRFGFKTKSFHYSDEEINASDPRPVRNEKNLKRSFVGPGFVSNDYFYFYFFNFTKNFWKLRDPNLKENYFYIYQNEEPYAFLGELELPFVPIGVNSEGAIYLLENDNPDNLIVGVYEVVETDH